jgi:hypothetical protein
MKADNLQDSDENDDTKTAAGAKHRFVMEELSAERSVMRDEAL